ncbi:vesicle-associated membrane protein-associated protein A-like [Plectropomus leopardus]|uniref:vesicle-associated membrane protein-associated protein A-like n=1 Tax=Plectropomus leopardus TaxID=160734 RepID=UPI001C4B5F24|nr:vesicle-associated membrane protein-associated protein A-like [Plectropomus leopardus]
MLDFTSVVLSLCLSGQNDVEATKAAPVMNSVKGDSSAATVPVTASLDDTEMKKILDKCKRLQAEMNKLADENRQLKEDGIRMRKVPRSDHMTTNSTSILGREASTASLPSLLVVIAAIFLGFFLGKFIL